MSDGMMNLQEVLQYLKVSEHDIQSYIRKGELDAYRIGGVYLRFRNDQVQALRSKIQKKSHPKAGVSRTQDFWRFNGFYIAAALVLGGVLLIIFR
jgi:excisionase family DNA binding protein